MAITRLSLTATPGAVYSFAPKFALPQPGYNFIGRDTAHIVAAEDGEYNYVANITTFNYITKKVVRDD